MDSYDLDPAFDVQVDYWSNSLQTFLVFGTFDPDSTESTILAEEELLENEEGKHCLVLRFKNCTGNIVDLSSNSH